jgi:hypothetical protein
MLIACLLLGKFFIPRTKDYFRYNTLRFAEKPEAAPANNFFSTKQIKEDVVKEIWLPTEEGRITYLIKNRSSIVTLQDQGNEIDLVEEMEGIKCWMQDRLYQDQDSSSPMQQLRYFEADQGTYQYSQDRFLADRVNLSIFRLPGHTLTPALNPDMAYLKGMAQHVSFTLGKNPKFQAEHFKAYLKEGK